MYALPQTNIFAPKKNVVVSKFGISKLPSRGIHTSTSIDTSSSLGWFSAAEVSSCGGPWRSWDPYSFEDVWYNPGEPVQLIIYIYIWNT